MRLSNLSLSLTNPRVNWWDSYRESGVAAALILNFQNEQYYNVTSKSRTDILATIRATTRPAWDENGDIVVTPINTLVAKYNPVTGVNEGLMAGEVEINRINSYYKCADGTGWSDTGSTSTNLSLNALGVFDGVSIASNGSTWNGLTDATFATVTSGAAHEMAYLHRAGTSGKIRFYLIDTVGGVNESSIGGTIGSVSSINPAAGPITNIVETLLSDGVTWLITFTFTPNFSTNMLLRVTPNSTTVGETMIGLGAFINGANEPLGHCPIATTNGATFTVAAEAVSFITVNDGGTDVPFYGFDAAEGTWLLKGKWDFVGTAYVLAGDATTKILYQGASFPDRLFSHDGTSEINKAGVFTDNTDIAIAMSYLEGGNFNILADGGGEASTALTGTLYAAGLDIGHLNGANEVVSFTLEELVWWPSQFTEIVRQDITS